MPAATLIAVIEALLQFAPQVPALVSGVSTTISLLTSGAAPTAEQSAAIEAALAAAHRAVQEVP